MGDFYYVKSDGTATKSDSKNAPASPMSMANCIAATFAAGDTVVFQDSITFSAIWYKTYSGTAGNPITFTSADPANPVTLTQEAAGRATFWAENATDIRWHHINCVATSSSGSALRWSNACKRITIDHTTLTAGSATHGIYFDGNTAAPEDLTIEDNVIVAGTNQVAIFRYEGTTPHAGTGMVIRRNVMTGGLNIQRMGAVGTPVVIANNLATGWGTSGTPMSLSRIQGPLSMSENTFSNFGTAGITLTLCTFSGGSCDHLVLNAKAGGLTLAGCDGGGAAFYNTVVKGAQGALAVGNALTIYRSGTTSSTNFLFEGGELAWMTRDGVAIADGVDDGGGVYGDVTNLITVRRMHIHDLGSTAAEGDGLTAHSASHDNVFEFNVVERCLSSGACMVNKSSGTIRHNLIRDCGRTVANGGERAGVSIPTNITGPQAPWLVYNNVCVRNLPREVQVSSSALQYGNAVWVNNRYEPVNAAAFAQINTEAEIAWSAWYAQTGQEDGSLCGTVDLGGNDIPTSGGNCDTGQGGTTGLPVLPVGTLDFLGRPALSATESPVGPLIPMRHRASNVIRPVVQLPEEALS